MQRHNDIGRVTATNNKDNNERIRAHRPGPDESASQYISYFFYILFNFFRGGSRIFMISDFFIKTCY